MAICSCRALYRSDIEESYNRGNTTYLKIQMDTGAARECGSCAPMLLRLLDKLNEERDGKV